MKITSAQILLALMLTGLIQARSYTQVLDREVTIRLAGVSFESALKQLEQAAQVKFVYSPAQLRDEQEVSIDAVNEQLGNILDRLFIPRNIKYVVHEREASITLRKQMPVRGQEKMEQPSQTDTRSKEDMVTVTGTVTDAKTQQPMPGVNVLVKGTANGTNTDAQGRYVLLTDAGSTLIFSFIGYKTVEEQVDNRSVIDILLQEDIETLKEVEVNAGYWKVKEKDQTGNIARVTAEEIEKQPVANPLAAMEGRMAGVYIQQSTGVPGSGYTVEIRGRNSIRNELNNNGNLPLYVVDGVPFTATSLASGVGSEVLQTMSPLNTLNPSDIESIEVLKDADATAIYGSRGANGVVLITTKRGKAGKTNLEVNVYSGVGKVTRKMDLLKTPQYLEMRNEAFANDNAVPQSWNYDVNGTWDMNRYTDWQKELIGGTASMTNAQATLSGGNHYTQFLVSGGYYGESTVFPGDFKNEKISGHVNLNHRSGDERFRMFLTLSYVSDDNNLPRADLTRSALTLQPNAPALYDENGDYNWENGTWLNPMAWYAEKTYRALTNNMVTNLNLGYEVAKGLQIKSSFGYTVMNMDEIQTDPISSQNPANPARTGSSNFGDATLRTWIVEPQAEYEAEIFGGSLRVLAGTTFQQNMEEKQYIYAFGYTNDALLENLQAAPAIGVGSYSDVMYRYNAVFGRINYNWKERYLVNLTARRDGSSRFGPEKQFANFEAIGAAWIFSNESFLKDKTALSFGKLRASYGTTGSDQIPDYGFMDTYASTIYPYQNVTGLYPARLVNPEYSWETNRKLEVATELGFFQDRMQLAVSWYRNRSGDQLVGYSLPALTGQTSVQYNLPAVVENKGWEIELNTINVKSTDFTWSSYFNITLPENTLLEYPNIEGSPYANRYVVGEPLSVFMAYRSTGVDPQTGLYTFVDQNEDGLYNNADRRPVFTGQHYYGGLGNTLTFKGIQLDFLFQFVNQSGINSFRAFMRPGASGNQPVEVMQRWQQPGDVSGVQRFTQSFGAAYTAHFLAQGSDMIVEDASFIRLKNVSLSYQLPVMAVKKAGMQGCRIYLQGQNLLTFTGFSGLDPENQSGILMLPPLRVITAGLQVRF